MSIAFQAAAIQFEPLMFEKERNVAALVELVEQAVARGADLVVTPEMGTTGYCWYDREEVAPFVEPVPGPTTDRFVALAARLGCHIVIGMPELDPSTQLYYNSAVLIGPDGIVGTHRKTHPYIAEPKWAVSGDRGHQVFDTPLGRIALLICMDIHFLETARLSALGCADVICHVSNWLAERTPAPYWISRAVENGCYLVEANRWGLERGVQFSGGSCIIAPDAEILDIVDSGDDIALATIDPTVARSRNVGGEPVFEQRRPELYRELMTNTFVWNPGDFFKLYGHKPQPEGRASRIAVAEFAPGPAVDGNLSEIEELAERAASNDAELVVLPARALTGLTDPKVGALERDAEALAAFASIAERLRIYLVAGFVEREDNAFFDSAVLAGPDGLVGFHRKIHLSNADRAWASPGNEWSVFDLPIGRLGLLVGHDANFPESGRVLALKGCDVIACSAAARHRFHLAHEGTDVAQPEPIPTGADLYHWHQFRVRAGENNCWFAFANVNSPRQGYFGHSGVFGPDTFLFPRQEAIVRTGNALAIAAIDTSNSGSTYPTHVVRRKDLVLMRQPHHYGALVV